MGWFRSTISRWMGLSDLYNPFSYTLLGNSELMGVLYSASSPLGQNRGGTKSIGGHVQYYTDKPLT